MISGGEAGETFWRRVAGLFRYRVRNGPIETIDAVNDFAATRAAFVSQKKLYGYLRTRMGTRYVSMFTDDAFVASINVAKMQVFAACLADLTIFCVSRATGGSVLPAAERAAIARRCFSDGLEANAAMVEDAADVGAWAERFDERLADVNWENAAATGEVFAESPKALVRWAPIAPELKKHDAAIVENSMRFAWTEVRLDFKKRLDAEAVLKSLPRG